VLSPDIILERIKLKRAASLWRLLFFIILAITLIISVQKSKQIPKKNQQYIARVSLEAEITQDSYDIFRLQLLKKSDDIKAVLLTINSPGGTAFAGEDIYNYISDIALKKPVVTVIRTMATSAAYMIALPSDRIIARNNSLTGSVGAILVSPDASELLKKIGIKFNAIKKGDLKASPLPYENMDEQTKKMLLSLVDNNHNTFLEMVTKHRKIPDATLHSISSSQIFTGKQALSLNLIDQIGGEEEAIKWLETEKKIQNLQIKDFDIKTPENKIIPMLEKQFLSSLKSTINNISSYLIMYK
jgi:protease IV